MSTTLVDLAQVLVRRCGMADSSVQVLVDPQSPLDVGRVLAESARQAEDVLLVCYVGHGLVSPGGELYLATQCTERRPDLLAYTALAYTAVRTSLLESPARSIVVILDCCFSGKAVGVLGALDDAVAVDLAQVNGGYVLTSAAREEVALAPPGARHTAFTGELIGLLTRGAPDGPRMLTLRYAYQYLNRALPARGFPKPHRRASEWIDDLVLAPNPAYRPPGDVSSGQNPAALVHGVCPYRGLAAFRTEDAHWFFGRERVTTELVGRLAARLEQARPLVLVGASGSGKSSLLRAGLLPALSAGTLLVPGSRTWPHLLFTPTSDPVGELAARVAPLAGVEPNAVCAELVADPEGFAAILRRVLTAWAGGGEISGARVVIAVDQFEETFLQCTDDQERRIFIRALCAAASAGDGASGGEPPALVVLGVRADLYDRCAAYPELLPALQDGQVVLGPMRSAEVRTAIESPAHAAGLILEPGLVETMLHELGTSNGSPSTARDTAPSDPGALPLLSHALQATWEHRKNRTMTVAGYRAVGGIRGAIATTAEAVFRELNPAGQQAARRLLLRMVQIGDGVSETRLRSTRNTLIANSPDPVAASAVFDAFIGARLITVVENAAEITHEALLRAWPRLRSWIDADRAGLYVRQELTAAAQRWNHDGRPPSALYRDTTLAVAQDWAQEPDHYGDLGTLERDFLATSQALRVSQQQVSHRRVRRARQFITGLTVLLMLSLVSGGIIYYRSNSTPSNPTAQPSSSNAIDTITVGDNPQGVAVTPDGRRAYITNFDSDTVSVIDTTSNTVTATIPVGDSPYGVAVTPDGQHVYITNLSEIISGTVSVIDTTSNTVTATIPVGNSPYGVMITPDGRRAYVTDIDSGTVSVIDTTSNTITDTILIDGRSSGVAVTPDGRRAYIANRGTGTVSVVDTASNTITDIISVGNLPVGVAVTPDGRQVYVTNLNSTSLNSGTVSAIDTASNIVTDTISVGNGLGAVAVTPDGRHAYIANLGSGTVSVIDTTSNTITDTIPVGNSPYEVMITPDGRHAYITNSSSGTVSVIDISIR